jgi:hypothetical protein
MSSENAYEAVNGAVEALIQQKYEVGGEVLDESWARVTDNSKAIEKKGPDYMIVSVGHPSENKRLFLLFSNQGELYDANFTGNFEGLE